MAFGVFAPRNVALCALLFSGVVLAQAPEMPATDYNKRLKIWQTVSPGGDTPFGERINLYTGELTFLQTDVAFPGIGPEIVVSRMTVSSLEDMPEEPLPFGNWDMALPRIQTLVAAAIGWKTFDAAMPGGTTPARCTKFGAPYSEGATGITLVTDSGDSQPLLRRSAENTRTPTMTNDVGQPMVFPALTNANWQIGCLAATTNDQPGEGFMAVSPEGARYWFTHLTYADVDMTVERDNDATIRTFRDLAKMYVSKIEDRFGNTLHFTYTGSQLTRIQASDGRRVDFTWRTDVAVISAVTMHATDAPPRTWQYRYALQTVPKEPIGTRTKARLTGVVLPDGSAWDYTGIVGAIHSAPTDAQLRACTTRDASPFLPRTPSTGTVTSPSGLVGTFEIKGTWHGRSHVQSKCDTHAGSSERTEGVPPIFGAKALTRRTMSGPGIPAQTWTYAYSPAQGSTVEDACAAAGNCPDTAWVDVTDPGGDRTRHWYSTRWGVSEGRSIRIETFEGASTLLKTETFAYAAPTGNAWPAKVGLSLDDVTTNIAKQQAWAPMSSRTITQQGVDFTWTATAFDHFARPVVETRGTSPQKIDATTYHDNTPRWILGQVAQTTSRNGPAGTPVSVSRTTYHNDLPYKTYQFEKLKQTITYRPDGTIETVSDARDSTSFDVTVRFDNWKRGIPQRIAFPDGHAKTAHVDDLGLIAFVKDENGHRTCYDFDVMGRLSKVTYPSETVLDTCDESRWNPLVRAFSPKTANDPDFGLGPAHWVERVNTGNGYTVTHYDALWRPSVVERYDSANKAATLSQTITRYDARGQAVYQSYPTTGIATYATTAPGTRTIRDALGRSVRVEQDAELGVLASTTEYLAGFQTRTTNARGFKTTTQSYQAYDQPTMDWPLVIAHPEGGVTSIARDLFGKPEWIKRWSAQSTLSAARFYTYNAAQELCRIVEPETGTTLMGYDPAGNLHWSASGLPSSVDCANNSLESPVVERRSRRLYDARNRLLELTFSEGRGHQLFEYTPDGLAKKITTYNGANLTQPVVNAYSYNARRMVGGQGESVEQTGWYTWSLGHGYDRNGVVANHVYPNGVVVDYAPNALGQATKAGTFATGASYHPNGALKQFTYGNGILHTMTQNLRQLPERSRDVFGVAFLDDSYDYDANGNVAAISDALTGNRGNRTMTYDGLDRLTSATSPMFGGTVAYTYDILDNLQTITAPGPDLRYCYDATNRLAFIRTNAADCNTGTATTSLGWDAQGNVLWKNNQNFVFGHDNRLREVTGVEGYRYDGHGRRVLSASATGLGNLFSMYSTDGVLRHITDARAKQIGQSYIYLAGSIVAVREAPIAGGAATVKYQHTDALGTPVVVTDASRNVIQRSEYGPYGKVLNRAHNDTAGYTGHVEDKQTGLTYMQQRYYDPQIGRFLSIDPVAVRPIGDNFNRYWYANNNPYTFTDPDGRETAMFQGPEYRMAPPDPAAAGTVMGLIADFTPVVGDVKGIFEALQNPTWSNVAAAGVGLVPIVGDVGGEALKHADGAISMTQAVEKGVAHVGSDAKVALTPTGNVQFSSSTVDSAGNTVTKNARFDVNPNSGHVQKHGPHLNLETQIKSPSGQVTKLPDPHTPIKPETIRRGDYE